MNPISSIVFHIPHASRRIPSDVRPSILLSEASLERELLKMTDTYTDELFIPEREDAQTVVFPVSRLVLDPERFLGDKKEIMAVRGLGVIYTRTSDGEELRKPPTSEERVSLIEQFYHPHHQKFEDCVAAGLQRAGKCLIIDCHSFPAAPFPFEIDQDPHRSDICIGTDSDHTPNWLEKEFVTNFERLGFTVAINKPFAGAIVPIKYYRKEPRVMSIMIELNRKLYMDEKTGEINDGFDNLKRKLSEFIEGI